MNGEQEHTDCQSSNDQGQHETNISQHHDIDRQLITEDKLTHDGLREQRADNSHQGQQMENSHQEQSRNNYEAINQTTMAMAITDIPIVDMDPLAYLNYYRRYFLRLPHTQNLISSGVNGLDREKVCAYFREKAEILKAQKAKKAENAKGAQQNKDGGEDMSPCLLDSDSRESSMDELRELYDQFVKETLDSLPLSERSSPSTTALTPPTPSTPSPPPPPPPNSRSSPCRRLSEEELENALAAFGFEDDLFFRNHAHLAGPNGNSQSRFFPRENNSDNGSPISTQIQYRPRSLMYNTDSSSSNLSNRNTNPSSSSCELDGD
ncbi:hypothetical protein F5Y09DRAFT_353273 [Xylaria sp. FL1042]|nr:hypothetical protein F5Y09DRAFT_353273 [Xylaria sp. FL1042]